MLGRRKKVITFFVVSLFAFQVLLLYRGMPLHKQQEHFASINKLTATIAELSYSLLRVPELVHSAGGEIKSIPKVSAITRKWNRNTKCLDDWCTSHLQKSSFMCYKHCRSLAEIESDLYYGTPRRCKFRRAAGHSVMALVSVPGSGNTWVRGLLEKATGICTGSIYCDIALRRKGFVGEYVHDGSALVVKTHTSDFQWRGKHLQKRNIMDAFYDAAILLVRNPFDTFVSERHRSALHEKQEKRMISHEVGTPGDMKNHLNRMGEEAFGKFVVVYFQVPLSYRLVLQLSSQIGMAL